MASDSATLAYIDAYYPVVEHRLKVYTANAAERVRTKSGDIAASSLRTQARWTLKAKLLEAFLLVWEAGTVLTQDGLAERFSGYIDRLGAQPDESSTKATLRRNRVVRQIILEMRYDDGLHLISLRDDGADGPDRVFLDDGAGNAPRGNRLARSVEEIREYLRIDRQTSVSGFLTSCQKRIQMSASIPDLAEDAAFDAEIKAALEAAAFE